MTLFYSIKNDGWNQELFWERAKKYKYSIVLVKTNYDKIMGGYMTDHWQEAICKDIDEETYLFYFDNDEIKICRQQPDVKAEMFSDSDHFLSFYGGFTITKDKALHNFAKIKQEEE